MYSPEGGALLHALEEVAADREAEAPSMQWQFVSQRPQTLSDIEIVGAVGVTELPPQSIPCRYVAIPRAPGSGSP